MPLIKGKKAKTKEGFSENNIKDYAYNAKKMWEEDQVGRPIFIILRSDGVIDEDIREIHNTFEEAQESMITSLNKGDIEVYKMNEYSIHSLSYPIPFNNKFVEYLSSQKAEEFIKRIKDERDQNKIYHKLTKKMTEIFERLSRYEKR